MFDPATGKWAEGDATTLQALWAVRDSRLKANQKLVLMNLILRAKPDPGGEGMTCFPSLATIAKDAGLSRRCVMGVIDYLLTLDASGKHGWFLVRKESGDRETSNVYTLDLDAIVTLMPHTPPKKRRA
jgi:hypothetical protein